jgi:hypothetical protein
MIYSASDLLEEIRAIGGFPDGAVDGYRDPDLLKHAASYIRSRLLPALLAAREEYNVQRQRIPVTAGQGEYRIPERAVGDKLRAIWWVDGAGNRFKLEAVPLADLHQWNSTGGQPVGFYLTANHINLVGNPGSGSLEVLFPFRVGDIVLQEDARQVEGFDPTLKQITFADSPPDDWEEGTKIDIHTVQGGHDLRLWGNRITNITGPVITLADAIDGSTAGTRAVEAGDWVCTERESALVALPEELVPALARGVAQRIAEAEGDPNGMQHHAQQAEKDQAAAIPLIASDRVQSKPQRFFGRRSPLFGG